MFTSPYFWGALVVIGLFALQWYYNQSNPKAPLAQIATGVIREQLKQDGDMVQVGDEIARVEFKKYNVIVEATRTGTLLWLVPVGQPIEAGGAIANITEGAEAYSVILPGELRERQAV